MTMRTSVLSILLAFVLVPLTVSRSDGALLLSIAVNGSAACASDNNLGCSTLGDTNALIGQLALDPVLIGGLSVTGSLQQSVAGGAFNILNSSSTQITNTTGATISGVLTVSATGFTPPVSQAFVSGSATWQDAVGSTVLMRWYNDPANGQGAESVFDTPGLLLYECSDTVSLPADATACAAGPIPVSDLAPFSMTLYTEFTLAPGATLVNRGMTELKPVGESVPEPVTLGLLGLGLVSTGLWRRRR